MKTKRTYITPETKNLSPRAGKIMQDDVIIFSGGGEGMIIEPDPDDSDGGNRVIGWTNHLWD